MRIGDKVVCIKQFDDSKGEFDGRPGTLEKRTLCFDGEYRWEVSFPDGFHGRYHIICHQIKLVEDT